MKGLKTLTVYALALLLLATFVSVSKSAPKDTFQRRNWTPQAMLYLKGTQGRRFISEDRNEGDMYDSLHLETRSQNADQHSISRAAAVLLNFLQQAKQEASNLNLLNINESEREQGTPRKTAEENAEQIYFQDLPAWKQEYF